MNFQLLKKLNALHKTVLVFSFLCIIRTELSAKTFYVSTKGNDNWSGFMALPNGNSTDGPFATIVAARNAVRQLKKTALLNETVNVIIEEGVYFLTEPIVFEPEDAGTDKAPVVYKSNGKAVFIGGFAVTNLIDQKGIWSADLSSKLSKEENFEQLYVNGKRASRARTPNKGFFSPSAVNEKILKNGTEPDAVQEIFLRPESSFWLQAVSPKEKQDVVLTFFHNWYNTTKYISDINLKSGSVLIKGRPMFSSNPINDKSSYFVENYEKALDTAGEWYFNKVNRHLYYIPRPEESLKNAKVYIPMLQQLLIIKGGKGKPVTNLQFENLSFQVSSYRLLASGQDPTQAAAPIEAAVMIDFAKKISFFNCEIKNTGNSGIWFREACSNNKVEHCYFYDLGASGIKIGSLNIPTDSTELTKSIVVKNNIIQSAGHVFPCAVGIIIFQASNNIISHNDIGDLRYTGISVGWLWGYKKSPCVNNIIEYNNVHHIGWGELSDMGGIYTLAPSPGTIIRNNKVHHVYSRTYGGWGIYADEGSSNILIENNVVYKTKSGGFHQHYGKENIVRNNIFALGSEAQLELNSAEKHQSFSFTNNIIYYAQGELFKSDENNYWLNVTAKLDSNCYWNTSGQAVKYPGVKKEEWLQRKHDIHSIIADPLFMNIKQYDFRVTNKKVIRQINFRPFDHHLAGVYGDQVWKNKANMPEDLLADFDRLMNDLRAVPRFP